MCKATIQRTSSSPSQHSNKEESDFQAKLSSLASATSLSSSSLDDNLHVTLSVTPHPEEVEETFRKFLESGKTANEASKVNLHILRDIELSAFDIAPVVEVHVNKLKKQPKNKVQQASNSKSAARLVRDTLTDTLSSKYTGKVDAADFVLLTRVYVASKGNSVGRKLAYFAGFGLAKITVSYCLYSRRTGKIVMAKQLSYGSSLLNSGEVLVQDLAEQVGQKMCREVNFVVFSGKDARRTLTSQLTL